jgi:hypothetical protein
MNLNENCGVDAFVMDSYPAVVQALYLLSFKLTLSAYQTEIACIYRLDIFNFRFFFTDACASKHLNKTTIIFV